LQANTERHRGFHICLGQGGDAGRTIELRSVVRIHDLGGPYSAVASFKASAQKLASNVFGNRHARTLRDA
jgi:hypothetical protein